MAVTVAQIRQAMLDKYQIDWFDPKTKRMMGDVGYKILHGKRSKKPFLIRSTYQWSDMFGRPKTLRYRVNELNDDLTIGKLLDQEFRDIYAVKDYLRFV